MFLLLVALACASDPADLPAGDGGAEADGGVTDGGGVGDGGLSDGGGEADGGAGDGGGDGGGEQVTLPPAVVLFIGDGMGFEHVRGGGMYLHGAEGSLRMESMPISGRLRTASLSGYTDSAASATAMATGFKTWNSVLGMDRERLAVENVLETAHALGLSTGVVTTDRLTGATPGAFTVHVEKRVDAPEIAEQQIAAPPDVLLGGGADDLEELAVEADVQLVRTAAELELVEPDGRPIVGIFAPSELRWVYEGAGVDEPSLAEMTDAALRLLEDDPDGFVLMVEGARIDHASHINETDLAVAEVAAFDEAISTALDRLSILEDREVTVVVTADHECGGLTITNEVEAGGVPDSTWVWNDHTNADVPVFAQGRAAEVFDGARLDNLWVHAVLDAAVTGIDVVPPDVPMLADGTLDDMGDPVTVQLWDSSFGEGHSQLDAMRLTADGDGLWLGLDGVFDDGSASGTGNAVLLLLDLDWGEESGLGRDGLVLDDTDGDLDSLLTALSVEPGLDGLGFDAAIGTIDAAYLRYGDKKEYGGLRGFLEPWGEPTDLWWLPALVNIDDGNIARGEAAPDAAATGETLGGMEVFVPWFSVFAAGLPTDGASVAVAAVLVDDSGGWISNQVLPPLQDSDEIGAGTLTIESVVALAVDGDGSPLGDASVVP